MSAKTKIGVIGTGQIGQIHLKRWAEIPEIEVVAACDIDEAAAERAAGQFGVAQVFADYRDLLAVDEIAAVDVCLHNNLHAPVSIAAMEAGKHVFCEKPIAGSYADGADMLSAAERTGRMLAMQVKSLFALETRAAKRLIDAGQLGAPYYAKSSFYRRRGRCFVDGYGSPAFVRRKTASGGALFDMGVYHIAQILYLLDNPDVLTISGATHQEIDMYADRRQISGYDVEEFGAALVRLAGRITLFIEEAWAINLGGTDGSKIAGSEGGLSLAPFALHKTIGDMEMDATADLKGAGLRWQRCLDDETAYRSDQHHWAAALRGDVELLPTAAVGLATMLITEGIYLSGQLAREVTAEQVKAESVSTALAV